MNWPLTPDEDEYEQLEAELEAMGERAFCDLRDEAESVGLSGAFDDLLPELIARQDRRANREYDEDRSEVRILLMEDNPFVELRDEAESVGLSGAFDDLLLDLVEQLAKRARRDAAEDRAADRKDRLEECYA